MYVYSDPSLYTDRISHYLLAHRQDYFDGPFIYRDNFQRESYEKTFQAPVNFMQIICQLLID